MWNSMPTMPLRPFLEEIVQSIYGGQWFIDFQITCVLHIADSVDKEGKRDGGVW